MQRILSEHWRATVATETLAHAFHQRDFDDSAWSAIAVPGHWQRTLDGADTADSVLYRCRFALDDATPEPNAADTRWWVTLNGVFYRSDVWLNDRYLGDTDGYFAPHSFEITDHIDRRSRDSEATFEHELAVHVSCPQPTDQRHKRSLLGVFGQWDAVDATLNPGGIWRPVTLSSTGPIRVDTATVLCTSATERRATVAVKATLDAAGEQLATISIRVCGVEHIATHQLASGPNDLSWTIDIDYPQLWWPHGLGEPTLHELEMEVSTPAGRSDSYRTRIGLRSVTMRNWIFSINGERLFLKGTNQGPTSYWLAETTPEDHQRDLRLARAANLNLIRVHAHITHPDFYAAADEAGMLIWQDLPLQWGYHRSVRPAAARQAREAVAELGHHPSIVLWCGHNEPFTISIDAQAMENPKTRLRTFARAAIEQQLPGFNRSILDRTIASSLRDADPSRPVLAHSGLLPNVVSLDSTDSHLYFGWYHGDERQFPMLCAAVPRMARFVSEFGAQSVPKDADFIDAAEWPDLDWEMLGERHCMQKVFFDRYTPPAAFEHFDAWAQATRDYQAMVVRFHIETLRRLKYRPTGGFTQFMFADSVPGITWSVLSADRVPKEAYQALAEACQPLLPIADRLPTHLHPQETRTIEVHVVNDLRHDVTEMLLTATLITPDGTNTHSWQGGVEADSVQRVGSIELTAPSTPGPVTLELELLSNEGLVTRSYRTEVADCGVPH